MYNKNQFVLENTWELKKAINLFYVQKINTRKPWLCRI